MPGPVLDLDRCRERYEGLFAAFSEVTSSLAEEIGNALKEAGIPIANVECRAKSVSSFVKKAIARGYSDPWGETVDKIGIRVTAVYFNDIRRISEAIESCGFTVVKHDDKRVTLQPGTLGYLATHIDAKFAPRGGLDEDDCICEIQIRSASESAWAYAVHDLMYKAPQTPEPAWERSAMRLLALVELFDQQIGQLQEAVTNLPGLEVGRLLSALEEHFFSLTASDYSRELSRSVLETLLRLLTETERQNPAALIGDFASHHRERLRDLYRSYLTDHRHVLVSQPESLLIFLLLDRDQYSLEEAWSGELPSSLLEGMAAVWGSSTGAVGDNDADG